MIVSACAHGAGGVILLDSAGTYVICLDTPGVTQQIPNGSSGFTSCTTAAQGHAKANARLSLPPGSYHIVFTPDGEATCHDAGSFVVHPGRFSRVNYFGSLC